VCVAQLEKKKEREKAFLSQATVASRRIRLGMKENKECVTLLHFPTPVRTLPFRSKTSAGYDTIILKFQYLPEYLINPIFYHTNFRHIEAL
jgi:hypothetical protein